MVSGRTLPTLLLWLGAIFMPLAGGSKTLIGDAACADNAATLEHWQAVYAAPGEGEHNARVPALAACLASPNPILRDRYAYEILTYWLRRDLIDFATIKHLRAQIQPWLSIGSGEADGDSAYGRAFAALVLSEIVRWDTHHAAFEADALASLLNDGITMLAAERDFRGLDADHGWIHTIAHGSDLLWRFARHPTTDKKQLRSILDAISSIVAPSGNHPYVYNEFDRQSRVIGAIVQRDLLSIEELGQWVDQFGSPRQMAAWSDAFASPAGMAELHNTKHFLRALLAVAQGFDHPLLVESIEAALAQLP